MLLIRESKFGKSRLVPLHPSTREGARRVRRASRGTAAATEHCQLLRVPDAQPAELRGRARNLPAARSTAPVLERQPSHGRGCTTCDTPSPSRPCSAGIAPTRTSGEDPGAVDLPRAPRARLRPTGICPQPRNCSHWPPPASTPRGRRPGHDVDRGDAASRSSPTDWPSSVRPAPAPSRLPRHHATAARLRPRQSGKLPSQLDWDDLDATVICIVPEPPRSRAATTAPGPATSG